MFTLLHITFFKVVDVEKVGKTTTEKTNVESNKKSEPKPSSTDQLLFFDDEGIVPPT